MAVFDNFEVSETSILTILAYHEAHPIEQTYRIDPILGTRPSIDPSKSNLKGLQIY